MVDHDGIIVQISITDILSKRSGMVNLDGRKTNGNGGTKINQSMPHIMLYFQKKTVVVLFQGII